jgi:hypothetical protein
MCQEAPGQPEQVTWVTVAPAPTGPARFSSPYDSFCCGQSALFFVAAQTVLALDVSTLSAPSPDNVNAGSATAGTPQSQLTDTGVVPATNAQAAPESTLKPSGWIVTFQTADQMFAGYDGQVYAQLGRSRSLVTWDLPITHFVRNGRYSLPPSQRWIPPGPPEAISMSCEDNWWNDHWTLDYVSWWDLSTNTVTRFDFQNQDVPMLSEHPSMVTANAWHPLGRWFGGPAPSHLCVAQPMDRCHGPHQHDPGRRHLHQLVVRGRQCVRVW